MNNSVVPFSAPVASTTNIVNVQQVSISKWGAIVALVAILGLTAVAIVAIISSKPNVTTINIDRSVNIEYVKHEHITKAVQNVQPKKKANKRKKHVCKVK